MASSVVEQYRTPAAAWTNWTTRKAVSEGYRVSGWVFRAVSMISRNVASVPWHVETKDGEIVIDHPITQLLRNPNPSFSRQDFFELLSAWQQLSGEAYTKMIFDSNGVAELWPVSPDRIAPIASKDQYALISAYEIIDEKGKKVTSPEYTPENVISFRFIDPSNPIKGIGPLQVAAKAVDIDVDQQDWNKSAMQNRGILDGVFTFDRDLDPTSYNTIKQKIKELFAGKNNARDIGVIGSNAKYQRLSLTPAEMDFITSRKFNREEIFIIFGVPPQLAGAQESSTYNNFSTSMRIFWELTLIPILDDLNDTLNHALKDYIQDGYRIGYDVSGINALKQDQKETADIAKIYSDMGVPVSVINERLSLGITEYDGWDKSRVMQPQVATEKRGAGALMLKKFEQRNIQQEIDKKEAMAKKQSSMFHKALVDQQAAVFAAMENKEDIAGVLSNNSDSMEAAIETSYKTSAYTFSGSVLVDERGANVDFETRKIDPNISGMIDNLLEQEGIILTELSLINKTTVNLILEAVLNGEEEGQTVNEMQQALIDIGAFSPERALRIARTTVGTAQSIGQVVGFKSAGATHKTWIDSNFEVRPEHIARDGEKVGIDERFSSQFAGYPAPRWPLDQNIAPGDRVNCRCSMVGSIE